MSYRTKHPGWIDKDWCKEEREKHQDIYLILGLIAIFIVPVLVLITLIYG